MRDLVERASEFAAKAHAGQKRKYTGDDYVTHTRAVAEMVRGVGADEETVAAAHLHDTIEDTSVSAPDLAAEFGDRVADLVIWLTDFGQHHGNRATRKALDRERLAQAPAEAQTIKLADMIDNTGSIVEKDPDFAVTYMREKAAVLPLLTKGDKRLWDRAAALLAAYETKAVADWLGDRPHA